MPPKQQKSSAAAVHRTSSAPAAAVPKQGKAARKSAAPARAPTPPPAEEEGEEEEEFSEPEEADADEMMAEYAEGMEDEDEDDDSGADDDDDDDDDDDGASGAEEDGAAGGAGSQKRAAAGGAAGPKSKKARHVAPAALPTNDEIAALRSTEDLFKSNLFQLQLQELLKEMHVDYEKMAKVDPLLHGLKADLENIAAQELSYDPLAPVFGAPLPSPVLSSVSAASSASSLAKAHSFPFHAPTTFNLVGSYPLRTLLRESSSGAGALNIDVVVEMPAECLKEKDYWDYRYIAKRARYLEHMAAHLMAQGGRWKVKLGKMRGAAEKPVLLLYPQKEVAAPAAPASGKKGAAAAAAPSFVPFTGLLSRVVVRLFVALPAGFFNPRRFHPSKSNLHVQARDGASAAGSRSPKVKVEAGAKAASKGAEESGDATGPPTPYYNQLLLEDCYFTSHLAQLYTVFQTNPAMKEALLLLKLWAKQRKLDLARGARGEAATAAMGVNGGWGEFELQVESSASVAAPAAGSNKKTPKKEKAAAPAAASAGPTRVKLVSPALYLLSTPCGGCTGVSGFFFSMLLAHLVSTKQLYRTMSTYQVFKIAMQALVKLDLLSSNAVTSDAAVAPAGEPGGVVFGFDPAKSLHSLALLTNPLATASAPREVDLLRSFAACSGFDVLFLDAPDSGSGGLLNFARGLSRQTCLEVKQEAFLSLSVMDDADSTMQSIFGQAAARIMPGAEENEATLAAAGSAGAGAAGVNALSPSLRQLATLVASSRPLPSAASLGVDSFTALFITPSNFHAKFDAFVRVQLGSDVAQWQKASREFARKGRDGGFMAGKAGMSEDMDALSMLVRQVTSLLELALGDRILLLHVQPLLSSSPPASVAAPSLSLEIGLLLNPRHAGRILEMGPSADDTPRASAFRALWGELSTLRRFKDGAIAEAVVWTTPGAVGAGPHTAPHLIPFQIVAFVLGRHLAVEAQKVSSVINQLDGVLRLRTVESQPTAGQLLHREGAGEPKPLLLGSASIDPLFLHASSLFAAFKTLSATLRGLGDALPLSVISLRMLGEFSRYTSVFASPLPVDLTKLAPGVPAHALGDVVPLLLQFESSARWPEDSLAISRIKTAFYISLGQTLNDRSDIHSLVQLDSLTIFFQGFIWRLKIFSENELKIRSLEERMGLRELGGPMIPVLTSLEIHREFVYTPLLSQQLKFVQERYPLFAPSVRLIKRWVGAHLFSPFFPRPEILELLVVPLFTNPKPYAVPGSAIQALHRFLGWVADFDFQAAPVIVDLTGEMKRETVEQIQAKFAANRANGTGSLIYIATEMDRESKMLWPRVPAVHDPATAGTAAAVAAVDAPQGPESCMDSVILARLVSYARSSLAHLSALLQGSLTQGGVAIPNPSPAHWLTLFKTPMSVPGAFDALLHLRLDALPVQHLAKALAPPPAILASAHKAAAESAPAAKKAKSGYKLPPDAAASAPAITLSDTGASSSRSVPLVSFSPLECYVASLRHLFGSVAYFFYDGQGGSVIGVLWREEFRQRMQQAKEETLKWSVKNSAHAKPVHDKQGRILGLRLHVQEILEDMRTAGEGLLERIQTAEPEAR